MLEAIIVEKHKTSEGNFTEKIISLYSRGMTTREITEHLEEIYGVTR
jgi:putative transposase